MNILCVSDGSDVGYESANLVAKIIDPKQVGKIAIILIAWPPHKSALWSKAQDEWLDADDLHEAMEIVVERELERYRSAFAGHAESIEGSSTDGDPVAQIIENADRIDADLILMAITDDGETGVAQTASELVLKSSVQVLVARGRTA